MPTTQALREQRANVWSQMTEIMTASKDRSLTGEETAKYDAAEKDLDQLEKDIQRQEAHEAREKAMNAVDRTELRGQPHASELGPEDDDDAEAETPEQRRQRKAYAKAFKQYMRYGTGLMSAENRQILHSGYVPNGEQPQNALGVGTSTAGGYTVPLEFRNQIIEKLKSFGAMRRVASEFTTDSGVALPWPTVDDTGNVGAILSENTQVSQQDVTFGTNQLNAWMYTSKLVLVSLQLIQDTGFDLENWLSGALGRRIGRIQNQHFTTGTGSSQPTGLVTGGTVGKQGLTGQTTSIIYDDLIDLIDALDPAYQEGVELEWMMPQSIRKTVRKLKDSQNRPLWEPSLQAGTPDNLLGYGIVINNDMPTPAASAKTVAFGNFEEGYIIRDVTGVTVLRLEERYADYLQVGFLAFQRSDGTVQNSSAYTLYQHSAS